MSTARPAQANGAPHSGTDVIITVVLLIVAALLALGSATVGGNYGLYPGACEASGQPCNVGVIYAGSWLAIIGPLLAFAVLGVFALMRFRAGLRAFWVPLLSIVVTIVLFVVATLMVNSGLVLDDSVAQLLNHS